VADRVGSNPFTPGTVLGGKYRVERVLGAGGMGVVMEATHLVLQQRVAVKCLLRAAAITPDGINRFLREGRAAARLQNEHVSRVMDVGQLESGEPYLVMEMLRGRDLSEVVREDGPLPVPVAVGYVLQACEAIAEAHAVGIVHRDLKPSNLFVTARPDSTPLVKVLDFGISKLTGADQGEGVDAAMTGTNAFLGSPMYMSPEQMKSSRNVDVRTDIWSLGAILYELLTGRPPFAAENVLGLIAVMASEPPKPPRSLRPDLPEALESAILACHEKDPSRRVQTVADLAKLLEPYADDESAMSVRRIVRILKTAPAAALATTGSSAGNVEVSARTAGGPAASISVGAGLGLTASARDPRRPWIAVAAVAAAVAMLAGGWVFVRRQAGLPSVGATRETAPASSPIGLVSSAPMVVAAAAESGAPSQGPASPSASAVASASAGSSGATTTPLAPAFAGPGSSDALAGPSASARPVPGSSGGKANAGPKTVEGKGGGLDLDIRK
jgi:serine/threonine-protein kinase